MYTEKRKYTDYNGNEREEEIMFDLSEAEVLEMEMETEGGMEQHINRIIAAQNSKELIHIFKSIIDKAYGVKSPDGRRFIKTPEVLAEFKQTRAYSDLFMKLATDDKYAAEFIEKVMPKVKDKIVNIDDAKPNPIPPSVR